MDRSRQQGSFIRDWFEIGFEQCLSYPCVMRMMIDGTLTGIVVEHAFVQSELDFAIFMRRPPVSFVSINRCME